MLGLGVFQALLDFIGLVLASIHEVVPNYGVAIIVLTFVIKLILLPLGIKQIKSMQAMQAIQPKIKEIQKKHKGNKQKVQEETMRLYKEAGVNPLGGCVPLLLQFPILIAMYAVIRAPGLEPTTVEGGQQAYRVVNNHLPTDSELFRDVITYEDTEFLWMNLQCSPAQSGTQATITDSQKADIVQDRPLVNDDGTELAGADGQALVATPAVDCGSGVPAKIPYFVMLAVMIGTTFYQQRQMQKASPPGAASQQQQAILKFMPIMFGFFGYTFPAGLVLYWTVSNVFQIGQQTFLLRAGHIGPEALERRIAEQKARQANGPAKKGLLASMMDRADQERQRRGGGKGPSGGSSAAKPRGPKGSSQRKPGSPGGPKKRPGGGGGPRD